jgi:hypothetical protein
MAGSCSLEWRYEKCTQHSDRNSELRPPGSLAVRILLYGVPPPPNAVRRRRWPREHIEGQSSRALLCFRGSAAVQHNRGLLCVAETAQPWSAVCCRDSTTVVCCVLQRQHNRGLLYVAEVA